jgi:Bacterial Ig-like domain (group 3)/FG-GAP-like repeat
LERGRTVKLPSALRENNSFSSASLLTKCGLCRWCFLLVTGLLTAHPLSAQIFKNPTIISTATNPSTISTGDFNGDGKPDLAYLDGSSPSTLHILLGNGDGTFQHAQDIRLPLGIGGKITVVDVNKDGKPDLVLGGGGPQAQIAVLLGNGNGTFQPCLVSQFQAGGSLYANIGSPIGVADFNGDGAVDLAAADIQNDVVYILLGNNSGSFTLKTTLFNGSGPTTVFTSDFNGDGHVDILVHGALGADATVYLGNGDGTFQAGVRYTGPHNISSLLLHDMDGDGHLDMVVTDQNQAINILSGNHDGTFASTSSGGASSGGPGGSMLAVFDFNSDGILDLATATANGVSILLGQSNLSYAPPVPYSGSSSPIGTIMADFNGDGFQDFAELAPGGIALVFGAPGGTLQGADLYDLGEGLNAVAVADFNSDHIPDIAVNTGDSTPRLLIGQGNGKFSIAPTTGQSTGTISSSLWIGDFNGDGKADLLRTGSGPSAPTIFYGNGNGTFSAPVTLSPPAMNTYGNVALGDFNHDGTTDIAALDYESLDILLGQRNNAFTGLANSYFTLSNAAAAGDFNNDGKLDLVVSQDEANPLQVLLGNGDGTFQLGHQLAAQNLPQVLVAADLDGDGKTDIAVCLGFFNLVQIFFGNGDGTFQPAVNVQLQRGYTQMAIADMNGDGKPDLVLSDGSLLTVIRNAGNRTFGAEEHYLAGAIASFVVKDVNGNGLPDIIVANGNTGSYAPTTVTVLINQGAANTIAGQLQIAPEPTPYGSPFTISLSMTPQGASSATPSGSVSISIDGSPAGSIPVNGLNLTYTDADNPALPVGVHTIVAAYSGDKNYSPGTFAVQHQIVPVVYPTSATLTATPSQVLASRTVRFSATVASPGQNVNAPNTLSGTVVFRDGTTNLGTATLDAARTATFDTALLAVGTHSITATYLGYTAVAQQTGSFAPSTSAPVTVIVTASPTNISLTAVPNSVPAGSVVSLTSAVTSSAGTPTGAVTFFDGNSPLSVQPLDGTGSAVYSATFGSSGSHTVTASYQANATFAGSASAPVTVTVTSTAQAARSSIQLSATPSSQFPGQITLTATVTGHVTAAGQVAFMDGGTLLGKAPLNGQGVALSTFSLNAPGLHYLTAYYPGNAALGPSISPAIVERDPLTVSDFSLSLSGTNLTVHQGQSIKVAATIIPINGFSRQVSLSCASASPQMSCFVGRASLPNGLGTSVLAISTSQVQASLFRAPEIPPDFRGLFLCLAALVLVASLTSKPLRWRVGFSLACFLCAALAIGCGSRQSPKETFIPVGTYVVTVEAVSTDRNSTSQFFHSVQMQVRVEPR